MTEKIPSSAKLGSRPSSSFIRSNSSGVRLWAAITSGVIIWKFEVFPTDYTDNPWLKHLLSITFPNQFFNCLAQLGSLDAADVLVNNFAFFVVEKSRRQIAAPGRIHQVDGRLRIGSIKQVRRHLRSHRIKKLRHLFFDLAHVVERNSDKLEMVFAIVFVN